MNSLSFSGSSLTFGNISYVLLFGWWISLFYCLICPVMYLTIFGAPYGTYLVKFLLLLKCMFFCGQQNPKFFSFRRQTVFKDGIVFYLAIWEVFKQGSATLLLLLLLNVFI